MFASSVRLSEALELMEQAPEEGFSLRFVQADVARGTGGKIVEWHHCRLSRSRAERKARAGDRSVPGPAAPSQQYENGTRNVVVGRSSQVRTVHVWLILAVNGRKVVLG